METTHTPGPWLLPHFTDDLHSCNCQYILAEPYMGAVATVHRNEREGAEPGRNGDYPAGDEARANARLIASAPDLLAATEDLLGLALGDIGGAAQRDGIIAEARAAIAKATGATP